MKYKAKIITLEKQGDNQILVRLNIVVINDPTEEVDGKIRDKIVRQISFHTTKKELKTRIIDEIKQCHKLLFHVKKIDPLKTELKKKEFEIDDKTGDII